MGTRSEVGPTTYSLALAHLRHPCRAVGVAGNETVGDFPPHAGMTCASYQCSRSWASWWVVAAGLGE